MLKICWICGVNDLSQRKSLNFTKSCLDDHVRFFIQTDHKRSGKKNCMWFLCDYFLAKNNEVNKKKCSVCTGYYIDICKDNEISFLVFKFVENRKKFSYNLQHGEEIATMSLDLLAAVQQVKIPHSPDEKLMLRIGLHTGKWDTMVTNN